MVDLTNDFLQAAAVTWACFAMGVIVFHAIPRTQFSTWLSRSLLALCPLVWTCWGVHAVRVNQQLAVLVEAKKSQGVDDVRVVQLAATNVVESRGGRRYERCEYTDGTRASWMRDISGRIGPIDRRIGHDLRPDRLQPGTTLDLPSGKGTGVRWY